MINAKKAREQTELSKLSLRQEQFLELSKLIEITAKGGQNYILTYKDLINKFRKEIEEAGYTISTDHGSLYAQVSW